MSEPEDWSQFTRGMYFGVPEESPTEWKDRVGREHHRMLGQLDWAEQAAKVAGNEWDRPPKPEWREERSGTESRPMSGQPDWSGGHGDRQGKPWPPAPDPTKPPHPSTFDGVYSLLTTPLENIKPNRVKGGAMSQLPPKIANWRMVRTGESPYNR